MHSLKSIYYHVGPVVYLFQGFVAVGIGGFIRATACYSDSRKLVIKTSILSINLIGTITVYSKFSSNELLKSYIAS